ncbi:MAG: thiamine phosphate synthase [Candidatus Aureabacteria bacterium]|nr:thiamine phosphate synthase [Candidatus Auribacterota bacterium]
MNINGYYFITDSDLSIAGNLHDVRCAVECDVKIVQYRSKKSTGSELYKEALKLKSICKNKTYFLINDSLDIAQAVDADGVHLGQDDIPLKTARKILGKDKIIGITVYNEEDAKTAIEESADYIALAPIFKTTTKLDVKAPIGITLIKKIKSFSKIPLIAIGGITIDNSKSVIEAGADGICAISAIITKDDVKSEIMKFQDLFL